MVRQCQICSFAIGDDARFCPKCGADLSAVCRECGTRLPQDARFCPSCATPVQIIVGGEERKLVTVLFADVVGSTTMGELLDPERLRVVLQSYFAVASSAIEAWGGTVEKFIGDAVMAVFGVPIVREDDAERALHASLDILDRLAPLEQRTREQHGVSLVVRVGINTGEVIAPTAGPAAQQLVAGDAVNLASRLQHAAEPGTILVGERTYLATRDAFEFSPPDELELRGKAGPVRAWRLERPRREVGAGIPGLRAPMIGRDRELRLVLEALESAVETERPQLVVVSGPAGMGKSRLLQETIRATAVDERRVRFLRGRFPSAGRSVSYWALAEIVRAAADISLDEPVEREVPKLLAMVRETLRPLSVRDPEVEQTAAALAVTAGLLVPDNPVERLAPADFEAALTQAWALFASGLAAGSTTVLAIEDLHRASDGVLSLLERMLSRATGPLVLLCTTRPEFAEAHPTFGAAAEATRVTLRPLTDDQSTDLVSGLLAEGRVPEALGRQIRETAEGNPFFLEEILRRLIDEGAIVREADQWHATDRAAAVRLPDSVHALLAARIDSLPATEKRVLQEASVVGRTFWSEPVRRLLGNGEVETSLLALERHGLVVARTTSTLAGQTEYMFKHALVRDVAFSGLPRARRAAAHATVGDWVTALGGGGSEEFVDLLAHFYGTAMEDEDADLGWAGQPEAREQVRQKAFEALIRGGGAARQRGDFDLALARQTRALELSRTDVERARALEEAGDSEEAAFHGEEAWEQFEQALILARQSADRDAIARVALKMARVATKIGTFRSAPPPSAVEELVAEGLATTRDEAVRARLLIQHGASLRGMYDAQLVVDPVSQDRRRASVEEAVRIAARLGDPDLEYEGEEALSDSYRRELDLEGAVRSTRRQLDLLPRLASRTTRAMGYFQASLLMNDLGDYDRAIELGRMAHDLAGSAHERMHGTTNQLVPLYRTGRWPEIDSLLAEHRLNYARESDRICTTVRGGLGLGALLRARQGRADEARELLDLVGPALDRPALADAFATEALIVLGDLEAALHQPKATPAQAIMGKTSMSANALRLSSIEVAIAREDSAGLAKAIEDARAFAKADRMLQPAADRAEAMLRARTGEVEAATELFGRAEATYLELGLPLEVALTRERWASVVHGPERERLRADAEATYESLGAVADAARVRETAGLASAGLVHDSRSNRAPDERK